MSRADPLVAQFVASFPDEAAMAVNTLSSDQGSELWESLPEPLAVSLFTRLSAPLREKILAATSPERLNSCISLGKPDEAAVLVAALPKSRTSEVMEGIDKNRRTRIERSSRQPMGSVGSAMTTEVIRLPASMLVTTALEQLRISGSALPICGLDSEGRLAGIISPGHLLAGEHAARIVESVIEPIIPLSASMRLDSIAGHNQWASHLWLPVVDRERRLLGVLMRQRINLPSTVQTSSNAVVAPIVTSFVGTMGSLMTTLIGGRRP